MPVVVDERCRLHDPGGEIWVGVRTPAVEVPARLDAICRTLAAAGAELVDADTHADDALRSVHDSALLTYLASAWDEWQSASLPVDPGQDRVVPYVFAHAGLIRDVTPVLPVAVWARPGYFAYDTMTLIGPGTWEAARRAVDAALTAVDDRLRDELTNGDMSRPLPGYAPLLRGRSSANRVWETVQATARRLTGRPALPPAP